MTHLRRYLEQTAAVAPERLDAALRRQQIYGGSLDSVLLELGICDPQTLCELLTQACGLPVVRPELLEDGVERPWDAVPSDLVEIGWAVPLAREDDTVIVGVHPDLPNERLGELYRSVGGVTPLVTPECCLEKLNAERSRSVVPQRYAVLYAAFLAALRRRPSVSDVGFPIVPIAAEEDTVTGPAPTPAPAAIPPPDPLDHAPNPERSTDLYGEPRELANDDEAEAAQTHPRAKIVRPPSFGPPRGSVEPLTEPPPPVREDAIPRSVVPQQAAQVRGEPAPDSPAAKAPPVRFTARGTMISTTDPLRSVFDGPTAQTRIDGAKARLQAAQTRDAAIEALVHGAMVISPRIAVFRIRGTALLGLSTPRSALPDVENKTVELDGNSAALLTSRRWAGTTGEGGFANVFDPRTIPCTLHRIDVAGRPVMALYADHDGREFLPAEANLLDELTQAAATAFEKILRQRRRADTPTPSVPPERVPPSEPAPATADPTPAPSVVAPRGPRPPKVSAPVASPAAKTSAPAETSDAAAPQAPSLASAPAQSGAAESDPDPADTAAAAVLPPPDFGVTQPPGWGPPPEPLKHEVVRRGALDPGQAMRRQTQVDGSSPIVVPRPEPVSSPPPPLPAVPEDASADLTMPGLPVAPSAAERPNTTPRFVPPPLDPRENSGIIPLAPPIDQPTARGRIVLDEEDLAEDDQPPPPDDNVRRAVDGVLSALANKEADVDDLRELGEAGLRGLASRFPGPLEVLRRDLRALPAPSAHGPYIRAAIRLGSSFVPHVLALFTHTDPDVRFYAAFLFQELRDPRAMEALSRLSFDGSTDVRVIAMRVLETYSRYDGFEEATQVVRSELDSAHRTRQLYAARAVGTLRDVEAIAELIELLSSRDRFIQEAALESLCSITGQQHGLKPHRWKNWFADHAPQHRVQWIIESLRHRDLPVRRWAHDELVRVTGHRVPFSPLGDRKSREVAYQAWREWWERHGRTRLTTRLTGRSSA